MLRLIKIRVLVTLGECHQELKVVVTPKVDFPGLELNPVDFLEHQQEECQEERHPVGHRPVGVRPEGHRLVGVRPEGHPESLLQKKKLA